MAALLLASCKPASEAEVPPGMLPRLANNSHKSGSVRLQSFLNSLLELSLRSVPVEPVSVRGRLALDNESLAKGGGLGERGT